MLLAAKGPCASSAFQALQMAPSSVAGAVWCGSGVIVDGMSEWSSAEVADGLVWIAACGYGRRAVTVVSTPMCCSLPKDPARPVRSRFQIFQIPLPRSQRLPQIGATPFRPGRPAGPARAPHPRNAPICGSLWDRGGGPNRVAPLLEAGRLSRGCNFQIPPPRSQRLPQIGATPFRPGRPAGPARAPHLRNAPICLLRASQRASQRASHFTKTTPQVWGSYGEGVGRGFMHV